MKRGTLSAPPCGSRASDTHTGTRSAAPPAARASICRSTVDLPAPPSATITTRGSCASHSAPSRLRPVRPRRWPSIPKISSTSEPMNASVPASPLTAPPGTKRCAAYAASAGMRRAAAPPTA